MIDLVRITVKAGDGGDGIVSFRREKFVPKGGPDGGNGGRGGDVFLVADRNLLTLKDFQRQRFFKAGDGKRGGPVNKTGRSGEDLRLKVPVGTIVRLLRHSEGASRPKNLSEEILRLSPALEVQDDGEREIVADLVEHDQKVLIACGGEGGRGNASFRSSKNRTPRQFGKGRPGEEKVLILELKLIADVGLIGLPNAGKSSLLNALTSARAPVANYPFTTLEPNLGVMGEFVIADIPGLIEGASRGKGLGDEFLRHIERTRILVHLIDISNPEMGPLESYRTIRKELGDYRPGLLKKPEIVVLSKADLEEVKKAIPKEKAAFIREGIDVLVVSSQTGKGLEELRKRILEELLDEVVNRSSRHPELACPPKLRRRWDSGSGTSKSTPPTYHLPDLPNKRIIFRKP